MIDQNYEMDIFFIYHQVHTDFEILLHAAQKDCKMACFFISSNKALLTMHTHI